MLRSSCLRPSLGLLSRRQTVPTTNVTRIVLATLHTSPRWQNSIQTRQKLKSSPKDGQVVYEGPYTKTFKYLKLFSLSSLALSTALSPFIFILESSLPMSGRVFLAGVAISTTTFSTYLISLFTAPYVNRITLTNQDTPSPSPYSHVLTTTDMFLRIRHTFLPGQEILEPSERPLTTWKLRESGMGGEAAEAVTTDVEGNVLGTWKVPEGSGNSVESGKVVRYFNVHSELLESGNQSQ